MVCRTFWAYKRKLSPLESYISSTVADRETIHCGFQVLKDTYNSDIKYFCSILSFRIYNKSQNLISTKKFDFLIFWFFLRGISPERKFVESWDVPILAQHDKIYLHRRFKRYLKFSLYGVSHTLEKLYIKKTYFRVENSESGVSKPLRRAVKEL